MSRRPIPSVLILYKYDNMVKLKCAIYLSIIIGVRGRKKIRCRCLILKLCLGFKSCSRRPLKRTQSVFVAIVTVTGKNVGNKEMFLHQGRSKEGVSSVRGCQSETKDFSKE